MKPLLLFLILPLSAFPSTTYTFSLKTSIGTEGFSYEAPGYLQAPTVFLQGQDLTTCDVSGLGPNWECLNVYLRQSTAPPVPIVRVSLTFRDRASTDPGGTLDVVEESFVLATLTSDGVWQGFQYPAGTTLTIRSSSAAVPEPSTWTLSGIGLIAAWIWKQRRVGSGLSSDRPNESDGACGRNR